MTKKNSNLVNIRDHKVAMLLKDVKVRKVSEFVTGEGRYVEKMGVNTAFSTEVTKEDADRAPKFVQVFFKKNPRVQKAVYSSNTRLLNKLLKSI